MRLGGGNLVPGANLPPEYWVLEVTIDGEQMILKKIEQAAGEPRTFHWKRKSECPDEDAWIFRTEAAANEASKAWHRGVRTVHRNRIMNTEDALKYLDVCYLTFLKLLKKHGIEGVGGGRAGKMYLGADIAAIKRARATERKEVKE